MNDTSLSDLLSIRHPIIMAPMFLVSNVPMVVEASKAGITGAIPALNWRSVEELEKGIKELKSTCEGPFGINLIVNKSNIKYKDQLDVICDLGVDYIITSLGSPEETIKKAKPKGIQVYCDVTDLKYAKKVEELGADAVIAVNSEAGGHAGKTNGTELNQLLLNECNIPVISAGGVANHEDYKKRMQEGVAGCSVGTIFIASEECGVSDEYKQACIDYNEDDIVMTTKFSGTPCTVINTPYVQEIGTKETKLERLLNKNKQLKKWFKMLTYYKGMKALEKAAFSATYKSVWCAGPSIRSVQEIKPVKQIVRELVDGKA